MLVVCSTAVDRVAASHLNKGLEVGQLLWDAPCEEASLQVPAQVRRTQDPKSGVSRRRERVIPCPQQGPTTERGTHANAQGSDKGVRAYSCARLFMLLSPRGKLPLSRLLLRLLQTQCAKKHARSPLEAQPPHAMEVTNCVTVRARACAQRACAGRP